MRAVIPSQAGGHQYPLRCPGLEPESRRGTTATWGRQAIRNVPAARVARPPHSEPAPTLQTWEPLKATQNGQQVKCPARLPRRPGPAATCSAAGLQPSPSPPASAALAPVAAAAGCPDVTAAHSVAAGGRPATPHGLPHFCHWRSPHGYLTWTTRRLRHPGGRILIKTANKKPNSKSSSRLLDWGVRPTRAPARPFLAGALSLGWGVARVTGARLGSRSDAEWNSRPGWRCRARDQKILSEEATAQSQGVLLAAYPRAALGGAGQLLDIWRLL